MFQINRFTGVIRKKKLAGPRPGALVTNLGYGGGGGPSDAGESSRAKRVENKSSLTATDTSKRSGAKASSISAVVGKRKNREDDSAVGGAVQADLVPSIPTR